MAAIVRDTSTDTQIMFTHHTPILRRASRFFAFLVLWSVLTFYWVTQPENANWQPLELPRISFYLLFGAAFLGVLEFLFQRWRYTKVEWFFAILLVAIPVSGNMASFAGVIPTQDWSLNIDPERQDLIAQSLLGFRVYIQQAILFFFAARWIASKLTNNDLVIIVISSAAIHGVWALAQILFIEFPNFLKALPIVAYDKCGGSSYCYHFGRAVGLTSNPFYFSWLMLVSLLCLQLLRPRVSNIVLLLLSYTSLSRGFILASLPMLANIMRKSKVLMVLVILFFASLALLWLMGNSFLSELVAFRFKFDISLVTRLDALLLVFHELEAGNWWGIGWEHSYYTDNTYATLLLNSGFLGLVFFVLAWGCFFQSMANFAKDRLEVLLFAFMFFAVSFLVETVAMQPGLSLLFVLYWVLRLNSTKENSSA